MEESDQALPDASAILENFFALLMNGIPDNINNRLAAIWAAANLTDHRNPNAIEVAIKYNRENPNGDQITIPYVADEGLVDDAVNDIF